MPSTSASSSRPVSLKRTCALVAVLTTCAFVTIVPSPSTTKPVPEAGPACTDTTAGTRRVVDAPDLGVGQRPAAVGSDDLAAAFIAQEGGEREPERGDRRDEGGYAEHDAAPAAPRRRQPAAAPPAVRARSSRASAA